MITFNDQLKALFHDQVTNWGLAWVNFAGLKAVRTKSFNFGDFEVKVHFNPARMKSSGAKMDAKTIAERKCFLCDVNRPAEQQSVGWVHYEVLVNPYPIFPEHFTIAHYLHLPQQIKPYFIDMLGLAESMDDYVVFYNGPECGASAPDHLHFQAGTKDFLPLVNDYKRLKATHADLMIEEVELSLYRMKNYLRTVYCIESINISSAHKCFNLLYSMLQKVPGVEPMMNIVCNYESGKWYTFVIPREAFRPWQFSADADRQLLISPAAVEMCGVFITPVESHFERISKEDVVNIFQQVSL